MPYDQYIQYVLYLHRMLPCLKSEHCVLSVWLKLVMERILSRKICFSFLVFFSTDTLHSLVSYFYFACMTDPEVMS